MLKLTKKSVFLLIIAVFLSLSYTSAIDFGVSSTPIVDTIKPDGKAEFDIIVENFGDSDTFRVSVFSDNWRGTMDEYLLNVPSGSSMSTRLSLMAIKKIVPGSNGVLLLVKSINDPKRSLQYNLIVNVEEFKELIDINATLPIEIDPRRDLPITLVMKNKGYDKLENVEINIRSDILSKTLVLDFDMKEEIIKDLIIEVEDSANPGKHTLKIEAWDEGRVIGEEILELNVMSSSEIKEKKSLENGLFVDVLKVEKENTGNAISKEQISLSVPFLKKLFTKLYPETFIREEEKYVWNFELEPKEKYTVTAITDYRMGIIGFLLVILFFAIAYGILSKRVKVNKKIILIKEKGIVVGLKVVLSLKNNTNRVLKFVRLIDYLPSLVEHSEEFGTIKPNKIQKSGLGTKLIWDIDKLEKMEERIISYEIRSRLHIIGRLFLPKAVVKYKSKKGKIMSSYSNILSALISKIKEKKE